jgi:PAS domain S-box-containing protein
VSVHHSLLQRQIKRCLAHVDIDVEPWRSFLTVVDDAYRSFDSDRLMMERSMDLSSTELIDANASLRESEERYSLAAQASNDGLWDWKVATNDVYFSTRWKAIVGHTDEEITNRPEEWFDRVHPQDLPAVRRDLDAHLEGQTPLFVSEHRVRHKSGAFRWVLVRGLAVRGEHGAVIRIAGSQRDITDGKIVDALTKLPNRTLLLDRVGRLIEHAQRHDGSQFAVLFIDLDGFKLVNESLGHLAADELLQSVARRLEASLRSTDTVSRTPDGTEHEPLPREHTLARVGGDEFVILLDEVRGAVDATRVADRIQLALTRPFQVSGRDVFATASIGIAVSSSGYAEPEEMVRDADTAMYRAKERGKGRAEVFDEQMRVQVLERLHMETAVRLALQRHEFLPHFQPIVDLRTGRLAAVEALLRWRHPTRGLVLPAEFVPLLEESGLVVPMGEQFFEDVCAVARLWRQTDRPRERLRINVNFASQQFLEPGLTARLVGMLAQVELEPDQLVVEITESTAIGDFSLTTDVLEQLQRAGIGVVLDDFGTGYSSLACLHRLPINGIKLDPSIIGDERQRPTILQAVVTLAHRLNLTVTAEGVETSEQCEHLRTLGCDFAQGYFFARPLDATGAGRALASGRDWLSASVAFD